MFDEVLADCIERKFDLTCANVSCGKNARLIYATYVHDGLGNTIAPEFRGPYLTSRQDYEKFMRGYRYIHYEFRGQLRVRRYRLVYRENDFADGRPDFPNFGFGLDQVFWLCPGEGVLSRNHDQLKQIVQEAADYEKRLHDELDRHLF